VDKGYKINQSKKNKGEPEGNSKRKTTLLLPLLYDH